MTAVYSGNATFAPTISAAGTVTLQQATPGTPTLTASPTTTIFGTPVTLTAAFSGGLSGNVTFLSGAISVGAAMIANGAATLTTVALPVGTHAVTATFTGNNNYAAVSSPPITVTITPPTYTVTAKPPSLTIHAGQTGTTVLTFTPVGGYSGTFHYLCRTARQLRLPIPAKRRLQPRRRHERLQPAGASHPQPDDQRPGGNRSRYPSGLIVLFRRLTRLRLAVPRRSDARSPDRSATANTSGVPVRSSLYFWPPDPSSAVLPDAAGAASASPPRLSANPSSR